VIAGMPPVGARVRRLPPRGTSGIVSGHGHIVCVVCQGGFSQLTPGIFTGGNA
jgi:hypothetical protein